MRLVDAFFSFLLSFQKIEIIFILKNYFNKFNNITLKFKLKSKVKTIKEWKPLEYLLD